mgnify:CR=1 FL=1
MFLWIQRRLGLREGLGPSTRTARDRNYAIITFMETVYVMTGRPIWRQMTKFWATLFKIKGKKPELKTQADVQQVVALAGVDAGHVERRAPAGLAGLAAHSVLSLRSPVTAGYGLLLGVLFAEGHGAEA